MSDRSQEPSAPGAATGAARRHQFVPQVRTNATETVLAIGPAGYGATYWRQVADLVPDRMELRSVRLPGRESRYNEAPYVEVRAAAEEIAGDLVASPPAPGGRTTLVGLCSGAVIAFEVARELVRRQAPELPDRLVLMDRVHPTLQPRSEPLHRLGPADLFGRLVADGLLPPELADDAQAFEVFERTWRADLELVEQYEYEASVQLQCSIVAVALTADHEGARRWTPESTGRFHLIDAGPGAVPLSSAAPAQLANWLTEATDIGLPVGRGTTAR